MPIHSVARHEFDTFARARSVIATLIMDEVEWFVDDCGVVIGFVARDKSEDDWSVCVLGPDGRGKFRPIDAATGLPSHGVARSQLLVKMENVLAAGGAAFPDGD
jgi:hypothetical protein